MPTRRELIERVTMRMRARGGEGRVESSLCFLRALLVGVADDAPVPAAVLSRVGEFLRIEEDDLEDVELEPPPPPSTPLRRSSMRISTAPPARMVRVLFLGRSDPARLPMLDAVATARYAGIAEVRSASLAPAPIDARAIKVLRHAGIETGHLLARTVSVDDLSWADLVVTASGTREDWERFIPRSMAHQHHAIPEPELGVSDPNADVHDSLRYTLRMVEKVIASVQPLRPSRFPPPGANPSPTGISTGIMRAITAASAADSVRSMQALRSAPPTTPPATTPGGDGKPR
jgi:protein-tyrosine-phosphatase